MKEPLNCNVDERNVKGSPQRRGVFRRKEPKKAQEAGKAAKQNKELVHIWTDCLWRLLSYLSQKFTQYEHCIKDILLHFLRQNVLGLLQKLSVHCTDPNPRPDFSYFPPHTKHSIPVSEFSKFNTEVIWKISFHLH